MKYRKFGDTELIVSEIGFGTWPLAGDVNGTLSYGKVDDNESIRALKTAFDNGINFYDTSDFYGFGHVESLIGNTFKENRNDIIICTKVGMVSMDEKQDFSTDYMVRSIEESLKRLKTDYIDVYLLHSPPLEILQDGRIISLLDIFKLEGKIREYGISLKRPLDFFEAKDNFNIVELNYNILDHRAKDNSIFDICQKENIATIIRTPLGQGIISGEFNYNSDTSDIRNSIPKSTFDKNVNAYNEMMKKISDKSKTRAQVALQYCLGESGVSTIIPGMKTENQVLENIKCCDIEPLSDLEMMEIKSIYNLWNL